MKVLHVSDSFHVGGAGRAAQRMHEVCHLQGIESATLEQKKQDGSCEVLRQRPLYDATVSRAKTYLSRIPIKLAFDGRRTPRSINLFPSRYLDIIQNSSADVVHLHWVNNEMLSIPQIGKISKPTVWTFHDMWPICGSEHLSDDDRWREGYFAHNKPDHVRGFDVDKWCWNRKQTSDWKRIVCVAPSKWMKSQIANSATFKDNKVFTVPNAINCNIWKPSDMLAARKTLKVDPDTLTVAVGSAGANKLRHKGFDLFQEALNCFKNSFPNLNIQIIIFGDHMEDNLFPYPVHNFGMVSSDALMRLIYVASNAVAVPSRVESFGQVASEAQCCGTPVIAYDIGGLKDIILSGVTGFLAKPFDVEDFANGLKIILKSSEYSSEKIHSITSEKFSYDVVGKMLKNVYCEAQKNFIEVE